MSKVKRKYFPIVIKLMILVFFICLMLIIRRTIFTNKANTAFNTLNEKSFVGLVVKMNGIRTSDTYTVTDVSRINEIIDEIVDIKKEYVPVKDSISYKGKRDYYLSIYERDKPANYIQITFMGNSYVQLNICNNDFKKYKRYRAKVHLTDDEISNLLSKK